jgi:hypothetical protein
MHTTDGCSMDGSDQTATLVTTNCYWRANGNSGCGSSLNATTIPNNYGKPLNDNGGGVYVTEWTASYVKHWFFPRGAVPSSVASGSPDISQFGQPTVNQQGPGCTIDEHFGNMSITLTQTSVVIGQEMSTRPSQLARRTQLSLAAGTAASITLAITRRHSRKHIGTSIRSECTRCHLV